MYLKRILVALSFVTLTFATKAQVSVTATAGTAGPTSYTTLNSAFSAINAGTHQGAITIAITGNTTEPLACVPLLKSGAPSSYTSILIKPSGGNFTINSNATLTSTRGVIEFNGADNVTIDGDDPSTSGTQNLSFVAASSTTSGVAVIRFASASATDGATFNTVKNCIITGTRNSETSTTVSYGIYSGTSGTAATATTGQSDNNDNLTIQNNTITRCFYAIYACGTSTNYMDNLIIRGNTIGTSAATSSRVIRAMYLQNTQATATPGASAAIIENNDVQAGTTSGGATYAAIDLNTGCAGTILRNNNIHDCLNPTSSVWGMYGIAITSGTSNSAINIYNNFIRDISGYPVSSVGNQYAGSGIAITAGATGIKINNNTIVQSSSATNGAMCIFLNSSAATITECQNNIFVNNVNNNNSCCIYTAGTANISGATMNKNDYYRNPTPTTSILGYYNAANQLTFSAWQTATAKDAGSKNVLPVFKSATDLHIDTTSTSTNLQLFQTGTNIASITTDIDGQTRNTNPCIGADEFVIPTCTGTPTAGTVTAAASPLCSGTGTTLSLTGAASGAGITYQWKSSTTAGGPYTNLGTNATQATGNLSATTYYVCDVTCSAGPTTSTTTEFTLIVNPTPTVSASASAAKYCGNTPVTLTASGATTYTWSPVTDLYTNAAGTTAYVALTNANPVYSKASSNLTYTVVGTTSGCTASNTVSVAKGNYVTISSVTAQSPSACSGGTDTLTVVATVGATVKDYAFSYSTGASLDPMTGSTTLLGTAVDNTASALTTFPSGFLFPYENVNYSQFTVSDNGVLRLGGTAVSTTQYGSITGQTLLISPWAADMGTGSDGGVSYVMTGTAPNRIFVVQYKLRHTWSTTAAINNTFQVWLYETSGKIEFRYGSLASSGTPAHGIGLSGASTANYQSVATSTNTASTSAVTSNATVAASGTMYTFTPPTVTYNWTSLNPSNTLINNTLSKAVATVNATGKYQIVVSESGGCSALDSTLSVALGGGALSVSVTPSNAATVCPATAITLSSTLIGGCSPFTYSWSTGATIANLSVSPITTTTYNVTVTDNASATASATYTVNVYSAPIAAITPATAAVCGTTPATLTASGGSTYKWSVTGSSAVTGLYTTSAASTAYTAGANQNPMYAKPTGSTSYTVTVTDANSCTATASRSVNIYNALTVSATANPTTACSGDTSRLNATASMSLGYGVSSISYSPIATPGSGVTTLCTGGTASVTLTSGTLDDGYWNSIALPFTLPFNGSSYTTVGIGTNGVIGIGSLSNTSGYNNSLPSTSAANPSFAPFYVDFNNTAGSISYFTTGTAPNRKFVINYTTVPYYSVGGSQTFQAIINEDGSFESHIAPYNATGSSGTKNVIVALIPSGTVAYASRNIVLNSTFTANEAWKFSPLTPSYTYNWSTPTSPTTISSTSVANPKIDNFGATETYVVTVTETTSGCSTTSNATVTLSSTPLSITSFTNSKPTFCSGDSSTLTINATGGCPPYTYAWSGGVATTASYNAKPTSTTIYTITVTDKGGVTATATTTVTVNSLPTAAISPSATTVCGTTPVTLTASGGTTYKWSVSGSSAVTGLYTTSAATTAYTAGADQNPMYAVPSIATTYSVTVTDANACSASATSSVAVSPGVTGVSASATFPTICPGTSIDLSSTGVSNEYTSTLISESFETFVPTGWTRRNPGSGNNWASSTSVAHSGTKSMYYGYSYYYSANTWAITPGVALTAGTAYQLTFWYKVSSATYPEKMKVTVGNATTVASQSTTLWDNNGGSGLTNTSWAQGVINYTPATSGTYYFGFNCYSDADMDNLYVDDVMLQTGLLSPTFAWSSSPAGFASSSQNPTGLTPSVSTTYTVTVTSPGGCTATASTAVAVGSSPLTLTSVTATNPSFCVGDSSNITVSYTGGCSPFTYTWSSGAGSTQTVKVKPTTTTTYNVTVTDNNGSTISGSATINVNNPQPASTAGASRCGNGTLTLSAIKATPTDSLYWYATATSSTILGTGTSFTTPTLSTGSTTYYVQAVDVTASISETVGATYSGTSNNGTSTGSHGILLTTTQPNITLTSVNIPFTGTGTFDIQLRNGSGTTISTFTTASVTGAGTTPVAVALNIPIATAGSYQLIVNAVTGTIGALGYSTGTFPYTSASGALSITAGYWYGSTTSNMYLFNLQATTNGCSGTRVPVVATVTAAPTVTLSLTSPATTCDNTPLTGVTASGTGYTNYAWSPSGTVTNNIADGSNVTLAPTSATTYSIVATGGGCSNTATLVVNVNKAPNAPTITLNPTDTAICNGNIVNLTASGSSALTTPAVATVGTGTLGTTISLPNPLEAWYGGEKHQMIYTVAELTGQGVPAGTTITSIAFNIKAFTASACNQFTIRLGHTSSSTLSGFISGTTTCYQQTFTPSATGWVTFTLTTPFVWNGTQNIVVETVHNSGNAGNGSGTSTYGSTTSGNMTYYGAKDNVTPAGVASFDALSSFSNSGATTTRPNVRFGYISSTPATYSWTPTNSSLYTNSGATTVYTGGTLASTYAKPSSTTTYTAIATVGSCSASSSKVITVIQRPTGVMGGSNSICLGATSNISVALTGTAPWTFTYTDGVTPVTVTTSSNPALISVTPTVTKTYTLTALSDAKCTAQTSDLSGSATLTMSSACFVTWTGTTSSDWHNPANWSPNSVPNSCSSSITIPSGTPNTPIISTTDIQVGNVTIGNGVNVTLQGAHKLMVCGNWTAGTSSNIVGGTTEFNGSSAQTITGTTQFEVLKLNNTLGATIGGTGTISVYSQYIPKLGRLTISSTAKYLFLSTSATHCATIDMSTTNTGTIVGKVYAQRFVPVSGVNQHYVSSPLSSVALGQFGANGTAGFVIPTATCDETQLAPGSPYGNVFIYDESNGTSCALASWKVVNGGAAVNARGYSAYLTGTTTTPLTVNGSANMSNSYSLAGLTNSGWSNTSLQGNTYNSGWSLVGNPYLSTINLNGAHTGFDAQAQVWVTSGPYAGTYQPVMMGSGSAYVAPFQGFMVHKTAVGGTATFTIARAECTNTAGTFYKTYASTEGTLTMNLSGNGFNDVSTVLFNANATDQFDPQFDANKLPSKQGQPTIATKISGVVYSVNNLSSVANVQTIPVQFTPGADGTFTINFADITTFDPTVNIYLEDLKTGGAWVDLRQQSHYTFTALATDNSARFVLHFTLPAVIETKTASCKTAGELIVTQAGNQVWSVVVKNVNGAVQGQGTVSSASDFITNNLLTGDYTVEFTDAAGHTAVKTVNVDGVNALTASFVASNTTPVTTETVAFTSTVSTAATYTWDFGDGTSSTDANPAHKFTQPGTYTVLLTVVNSDGCEYSYSRDVTVTVDVTGIKNPSETNKFVLVYVNNGKMLNITFEGYNGEIATIQAYNLLGQEILNVKHNTGTKFVKEMEQVEAAYVVVGVTIDGKTVSKKVLITKE